MAESERPSTNTLIVYVRNEEQAAVAHKMFGRAFHPEISDHPLKLTPTVQLIQCGQYDGVKIKVLDPNRPFEKLDQNEVYLAL